MHPQFDQFVLGEVFTQFGTSSTAKWLVAIKSAYRRALRSASVSSGASALPQVGTIGVVPRVGNVLACATNYAGTLEPSRVGPDLQYFFDGDHGPEHGEGMPQHVRTERGWHA